MASDLLLDLFCLLQRARYSAASSDLPQVSWRGVVASSVGDFGPAINPFREMRQGARAMDFFSQRSVRRTTFAVCALSVVFLALGCPSTKIDRQPKTLLAVFAHPDDEAFVGPLLSHYARQGVRIRLAIVTEGAKVGSPRLGIPAGPEMARVRAQEARCSCRALGVEAPILLGFEDGGLGKPSHPPDGYLAQVVRRIRELFAQVRPDAVITWGPDGGYGHPDHRLVGAVVTQVVQAGADGAPSRLFYPGLPADPARPRIKDPRWALTDPRFLTVRIPYDAVDFESTRRAFACHQSQFSPEQLEGLLSRLQKRLRGRVYLRPWFGGGASDDVFSLEIP